MAKCRAAQRRARIGRLSAVPSVLPSRAKDIDNVVRALKKAKDPATKDAIAAMAEEFVTGCGCDMVKFCAKYNIEPDAVPAIQQIASLVAKGMPLSEALAALGGLGPDNASA